MDPRLFGAGPLTLVGGGGGIVPTFGRLPLPEAEQLLQGVHAVNVYQLQHGVPPVSAALKADAHGRRRLRYIRDDPDENWQTIRDIWRRGGGDCEDLAAAVSAEIQVFTGYHARPRIMHVRPGLAHGVVEVLEGPYKGRFLDPSKTGGMGGSG